MLKDLFYQMITLPDLVSMTSSRRAGLKAGLDFVSASQNSLRPGMSILKTQSLDSLCRTPDGQLLVFIDYKFLSWCFINQYLVLIPQALFAAFLFWRFIGLLNTQKNPRLRRWDFYLKNGLMILQFVIVVICAFLENSLMLFNVTRLSSAVTLSSTVLVGAIQYLELGRTFVPSDVVLWYWFIFLITGCLKMAHIIYLGYFKSQTFVSLLETSIFTNGVLVFLFPKYHLPKNIKFGEDLADAFSRASLTWTNDLFTAASKGEITSKDMPAISHEFHSKILTERFEAKWNSFDGKGDSWVLAKVLFSLNGWRIVSLFGFQLLEDIMGIIEPVILGYLINYALVHGTENEQPFIFGIYIAISLFLVQICQLFAYVIASYNEMYIRAAVKGLVYGVVFRKSLRFSPKSREEHPTSQLMNMVSTDFLFIMQALVNSAKIIIAPFQLVFCFMALYKFLGVYMWVGVVILCVLTPSAGYANSRINVFFRKFMKAKDERVKLTSSMLANAKSLKLYAWESAFLKLLNHARNEVELGIWQQALIVWVAILCIWLFLPYFVITGSFFAYGKFSGNALNAAVVFPTLSLFSYLSKPLSALPQAIMMTIQGRVSFGRMAALLSATEKDVSNYHFLPTASSYSDDSVVVDCEKVAWSEQEGADIALENIKFSTKKCDLACIIGKVGSGKTAFLTTLCGLTHLQKNCSVTIRGNLAYVPQEAWLINQSIRENILFGHRMDPEFYQRTLEACCLDADIVQFPDGDETEIGEKGITLSGGQKARVSLARAVYARADIYILDDVLSAVDEHVARHIIDNVLGNTGILSSKTRILATNNIKVLHEANSIYMLEDKTFIEHGTVAETFENSGKIGKLIKEFGNAENLSSDIDELADEISIEKDGHTRNRHQSDATLRRASVLTLEESDDYQDEAHDKLLEKSKKGNDRMSKGRVNKKVFMRYFKSSGYFLTLTSLAAIFLSCIVQMISSIWLKILSQQNLDSNSDNLLFYLGGYFIIGLMVAAFYMLAFYCMIVKAALTASKKLHSDMMRSVLRSPMYFFESTPIGQILNRFTNDVAELDLAVPQTIFDIVSFIGKAVCALLIVIVSSPLVLVVAAPLTVIYGYYQHIYVPCTRQMKRIASASSSPVLSHMEESLKGAHVISAFKMDKTCIRGNDIMTDFNLLTLTLSQQIDRWLQLRLNFIGAFLTFTASVTGVFLASKGRMSGPLMGLMIASAIEISTYLSSIVNNIVDLELRGVTLERITEYIELPSEAPSIIENNRPPATWPTEGGIEFEKYSARYRENLDLVLKEIDLKIKPREKIGVVGRTGAGKSSLTLALFRMIEAASGSIEIDSIHTDQIGLEDLRKNISIIPQDAQIFEGTVRDNIDPKKEHDDTSLWQVLEICHLKKHVQSMDGQLEAHLSESGGNLSRGQAQLICLVRALLHPSNILVLDEATASVDVETDTIIQKTIRSEFKHKTIFTIAHRLNTIMDSDKIAVLELGKIVEFDTPERLLENKQSLFYSLCEKGGFISSGSTTKNVSSSSSIK